MKLGEMFGSAWGKASDAADNARERVQERLVVVGARDSGLSVKWALVVALCLFLIGGFFGYKIGGIQYREFVLRQAVLLEETEARNKMLLGELEVARKQLNDQEEKQHAADKLFDEKLNKMPVSDKCVVPVNGLNITVREANQ